MDTAAPSPVPETEKPAMGFLSRLIGVFVSPTEAFTDIVRRPARAWIAPVLLLTVFSTAFSVVLVQRGGFESLRAQMMDNPRMAEMPAEQRDRVIDMTITGSKYSMYVLGPLGPFIATLAIAGILLLITNFVLGGATSYSTMLAITAFAWLPNLIQMAAGVATMLLKPYGDFDMQNLVVSNLGPLADPKAHKALYWLLMSVDAFSFWKIALLGLGISIAARFSFKKGLIAVILPWAVIWVLVPAGWKAIF